MADTVHLTDNAFNEIQNTDHTISASEEASGFEVWHIANGRRSLDDKWKGTTENTAQWVKVDAGAGNTLTPTMMAIDRGHNLEGKTLRLEYSLDDAAFSTEWTVTFPSAAAAGTDLDTANGAYTEEGAWVKRWTSVGNAKRYWRLTVTAAASYIPEVVGLWMGVQYVPAFPAERGGFEDESGEIGYGQTEGDLGWVSRTVPWSRQAGTFEYNLSPDGTDKADARTHILQQFLESGRLMWVVFNDTEAEKAVLVEAPPHRYRWGVWGDWIHGSIQFQFREHEPKPV